MKKGLTVSTLLALTKNEILFFINGVFNFVIAKFCSQTLLCVSLDVVVSYFITKNITSQENDISALGTMYVFPTPISQSFFRFLNVQVSYRFRFFMYNLSETYQVDHTSQLDQHVGFVTC